MPRAQGAFARPARWAKLGAPEWMPTRTLGERVSGGMFGRVAFAGRDSADPVRIPEKRRGCDSRHLAGGGGGGGQASRESMTCRPVSGIAGVSDVHLDWVVFSSDCNPDGNPDTAGEPSLTPIIRSIPRFCPICLGYQGIPSR